MMNAEGDETVPHREWLIVFDRVINEVKATMAQQGREDEFVGCKVCRGCNIQKQAIMTTFTDYL